MNGKEQLITAAQHEPDAGFDFAGFRLERDGTLFRGRTVVHLSPKELAALRVLLAHAGRVVTPAQLRQQLWADIHVTEESVSKCLSSLRSRLAPEECIQTVYKRGYRLSGDVRRHGSELEGVLPRLAILPFATGFGVPEHIGLAAVEETIDRLVNLRPPVVSVIARDSAFTLARAQRTAQQVGEALKADFVLTGTLRALPSHFRLRAQMMRVEDGTEIWVEDLLVDQSRIGGLESELVDRLISRLGETDLSIAAAAAHSGNGDANPPHREAQDLYLRARYEWRTMERHRTQDALQNLLRATEIDPSLTPAQVDLANLCCSQAFYGFMAPSVAARNVLRAAESISQSSQMADAIQPALGWVKFHVSRDLNGAIQAFSRGAHLSHDPLVSRWRVMFALSRQRFQEAAELLEEALCEDPFSPWLIARLAWTMYLGGDAGASLKQIERGVELFPGNEAVACYGAIILAFHGDADRAVELAGNFVGRYPYMDVAAEVHAYALARAGRGEEAQSILDRLQWLSRERFVMKTFMPAAYVALGDFETALTELQAADESRCPWFFQMLADPRIQPLEKHREFAGLKEILAGMEARAELEPNLPPAGMDDADTLVNR